MPPGGSSSGGFRGFIKRSARRAKNVLRPETQASATHTSSPSPPPQPSAGAPPAQPTSVQQLPTQPSVQPQQTASSRQPAPNVGQITSAGPPAAVNSIQPANSESRAAQAAKKVGEDAWTGLKATLELVKESSDVFPPLKSAVGGFLGVIGIFETAARNRGDYTILASNLQAMAREFAERPGEQTSSRMLEALDTMTSALREELAHLQEQQQHSVFRRHLEAGKDTDDVQECYKRVETLRNALQDKAMMRIWRIGEEQNVDARLEKLNASLKAMYNSTMATVIGRRKCTPGTRKAILAGMQQWTDSPDGPKVYWLNGMAGTGKTTLAYSFCAEMELAGRLGASFFCSRADADSQDVSRIIPTVAYQLARLLPTYREVLIRQIGEDKDIGARETNIQFKKLIRDPLLEVADLLPKGIIVAIDALDECDRRDGAQDILNVLLLNAIDLPIKFLVTCRPEPGLFDVLQPEDEHRRSVLHLHDIETSFVQADIRTYLEAELGAISLPQEKVEQLAEQAGRLFIYAATAVRYIRPKVGRVKSEQRLDQLLSITSKIKTNKHRDIDDLYTAVLSAPFADEDIEIIDKENIRLVLDTAICAREPMSVTTMTKLLELGDDDDLLNALQHLRSVLHVSQDGNFISTLHASFPDFVLNRERSKGLCCNSAKHHEHLSLRCFGMMEHLLRFNICELESSFVLDEAVPGLAKWIDSTIPPELFYACRYWGDHMASALALDNVHSALKHFLSQQLLFWTEVLNFKKCIGVVAQMLTRVHVWLQKLGGTNSMLELVLDAGRFVTAFGMSPASRSTPHIYISALPFWPETRPVRQQYWRQMRGLMDLGGAAMERKDLSCLATWNAANQVCCVSFSPDSTRIVSGCEDGTISIWDALGGFLVVGPFKGHTGSVSSVGFSPDGTRIVSGSRDTTVRVWDARSAVPTAGSFQGHAGWVHSVSFSPDGTRIVSGSDDRTICVWDARRGVLIAGPFEGHTGPVNSVGFSSDGTLIVSGSVDRTVRVWDARSKALVAGPFDGHTDSVYSVAFSPDNSRVVSGSWDKTVRVWDASNGLLIAGPFKGHSRRVYSVGFSPDGTCVVSGSDDRTICVWDARSGDVVAGPFEGHTGSVNSAVYSSDGSRIVSGSRDRTIRVWDARSGLPVAGSFEGHTNSVNTIALSLEGNHIASGSRDTTIHVWDTRSGALVAGPFEGHTSSVTSVAFSSNGAYIVSGSDDHTIRVWNAHSGTLVAGPFEGHSDSVNSIALSFDGAHVASGSDDKTIRVWNTYSGDAVAGPFEGHTDVVNSVVFSPDGTCIASGSGDLTIRVCDARSGVLVAEPFHGHTQSVYSVAFSPDGACIVSGSVDRTIRVWDARSGVLVAGPFQGHTNSVYSVGFSTNGIYIVSGSADKTVRVWDARSGDIVAGPFEGHANSVNSVAYSPDGTYIISGSSDHTVRVWQVAARHLNDPKALTDWSIDENGMVKTSEGELLLCVPRDLWTGLTRPQNALCIYRKGALRLNFDGVLLGADWVRCGQSQ